MITTQLLRPESIVVVGASNNVHKPGGAILKNLINGGYQGELRAVNPKETEVQGVPAFADVKELPDTDLAVLAVPAVMCPDIVETLASEKQTRAFIILSAGFGEETREGALLEERILETVNKYGASLIGPNCIGFTKILTITLSFSPAASIRLACPSCRYPIVGTNPIVSPSFLHSFTCALTSSIVVTIFIFIILPLS